MTFTRPNASPAGRLLLTAAIGILAAILLLAGAGPADANSQRGSAAAASRAEGGKHGKAGKRQRAKARKAQRRRARRARARRNRGATISRNRVVSRRRPVETAASSSGVLDAGCEGSLFNWNTAGVGEAIPTPVNDLVRSGSGSCRVALSGTQHRSELILGGNGGGSTKGMIEFDEGDEAFYAFSFYIGEMTYGRPGAHNLIMQFKGDDDGSPAFGLQLWDYEGDDEEYEDNPKGLWSHGPSMGGDRFLALAPERTWHDVVVHFKASGSGNGFYEIYFDGRLVDSRSGVSMIADGAEYAYIKSGLYRNGDEIPGDSELRLDAARLGPSLSSVSPS
jgi:Polysaccharide lyase